MRRLILIALGLVLVLGALIWLAVREVPLPIETAEVAAAPMEVTIDVDGKTRIREVYEVSSPIAGLAQRSPVRVGDHVIAETVVAVVRPIEPALLDARSRVQAEAAVSEAEAALRVAEGQLRQAQEDLDHAQVQFNRTQELVERGAATLTRLEDAQQMRALKAAAHDVALSTRDMAKSAVERAKALLITPNGADTTGRQVELKAPVTGQVLSVSAVSERPVGVGTLLVTLGAPDDIEIIAAPLSQDAVKIPAGALAYVERWGGAPLMARLRLINPSGHTEISTLGIEEQRVDAWFDFVDPSAASQLGDGYAVHLRVLIWQSPQALQVPTGALFREGESWAVFKVTGDRAVKTRVEIGQRGRTTVEITDGLAAGDKVITHPSDQISDGTLVEELSTAR